MTQLTKVIFGQVVNDVFDWVCALDIFSGDFCVLTWCMILLKTIHDISVKEHHIGIAVQVTHR